MIGEFDDVDEALRASSSRRRHLRRRGDGQERDGEQCGERERASA